MCFFIRKNFVHEILCLRRLALATSFLFAAVRIHIGAFLWNRNMFLFHKKRKWRRIQSCDLELIRKLLCCILILELAYGMRLWYIKPIVTMHQEQESEILQDQKPELIKTYGISFEFKEGKLIIYRREESIEAKE